LGGSSKLHSAKSLEGTSLCNVCSQKKEIGIQKVTPTHHWYKIEYEAACWDPCKGQINALDRVQTKAAQFTNPTKNSEWETLA